MILASVAFVSLALSIASAGAEVITLSCATTMKLYVPGDPVPRTAETNPETVVVDLSAETVQGPAGTAAIGKPMGSVNIWWMAPYHGGWCQNGNIDRVNGEYENFVWEHSCDQVSAVLTRKVAGGLSMLQEWRGFCKPAKPMF